MLYAGGLVGAVLLLLWLFCIIDVIMTPESEIRHLPKLLWLLIVVALLEIGAVIWLIAGRPRSGRTGVLGGAVAGGGGARRSAYPEYDRPGRFAATNPDDDDEFLARVRERAEAQRRAESQRRREREEAERAERERRRQSRGDGEGSA